MIPIEPFLDLSYLADNPEKPVEPGIDLNLSEILEPKKTEISPTVSQTQLKTESEIQTGDIDALRYYVGIIDQYSKLKLDQEKAALDKVKTEEAKAKENTKVATDQLTTYLEKTFNTVSDKVTENTTVKTSDTTTTSTDTTVTAVSTPMIQLEELKTSLTPMINLNSLLDDLNAMKEAPAPTEPASAVVNNQLVNTQETTVDQTSQNISNLSDTVSNFATNIVNGTTSQSNLGLSQIQPTLAEPKKELLPITKEAAKPDLSGPTLSALKQMADTNQQLVMGSTTLNTTNSQYNTNTINPESRESVNMVMPESEGNKTTVVANQANDTSSVYLMQMLNLMKSGQLKVKLQ